MLLYLFSSSLFADALYDQAPQIAAEAVNNAAGGGLQFIFNKSNKTVVIELGDFIPTRYTLNPGEHTIAIVTTDRQAITIRSAD